MALRSRLISLAGAAIAAAFGVKGDTGAIDINKQIAYCAEQATKTLAAIPDTGVLPRSIPTHAKYWKYVEYGDWTSGFWPGELWYLYEATGDEKFKTQADKYTRLLTPLSGSKASDHDLGFQVFNSFGNGYRLTQNPEYKEVILKTADTLATLITLKWARYNPGRTTIMAGTIPSSTI